MDNNIINLYKDGNSIRKVAVLTGISATQIRRILKKNNVEARDIKTSKEIEKQIIERYNSGINSEILAEEFNINASTICRIIKRNGYKIRPPEINKRKYLLNENFFETIDTEEKSYLLGFLYADGNVSKDKNDIKIEVHERDIDILEKFAKNIYIGDQYTIGTDRNIYKYIRFSSKKIKEDLTRYGCIPNKTFSITLPSLSKNLMNHFIRGFYDGDGCISIDGRVRIILTGYYDFINEVKNYLKNNNINGSIRFYKNKENICDFTIGTINDGNKMLDYLYDNASIYLDRKYKKYKEAKKILENKQNQVYNNKNTTNLFTYNSNKLGKNYILSLSLEDKLKAADEVFNTCRGNGFPYPTFTDKDLIDDFKKLCNIKYKIENEEIKEKRASGLKIFKHFCSHYFSVTDGNMPSLYDAFCDDDLLLKAIHNRMGISYKETFGITGNMIRQGLRNGRLAFAASIFKPSVAKCIYDNFAPNNSKVLDISAGFGQRMLGAMASDNVAHYTAYDPWGETIGALKNIKNFFDFKNIELHNVGSENINLDNNSIDFCFSSPPFFNKEVYKNDPSQAYNNKTLDQFIDFWWRPTCENVFNCLKNDGLFVLNMDYGIIDVLLKNVNDLFKIEKTIYISYKRGHLGKDSRDNFYILRKL